ncbi:MAG TPA: sulfite exporter TauE/SafE family protein [Dehalococcoidia bacterium]|nr:sulfite exporter TauE/SafE family protein [Dehalococcoidia bacterium]
MITFPMLPGIEINLFLLVFTGLGTGLISGFAGVGGGFLMTPALIILGFPANIAVGTSLAWVAGNSVVGAIRHGRMGNIDIKLGLVMILSLMSGMEIGVRILNRAKGIGLVDESVLSVSLVVLLVVGTYMVYESVRRKRQIEELLRRGEKAPPLGISSIAQKLHRLRVHPVVHLTAANISVSLWIIVTAGFCIGILAGVMGIGGGFITVPTLVYLVGVPSFVAAGTNLFQVIFASSYGVVRHSMSGNVVILASFIILIASSIGVQLGVLTTRYVRAVSVRYILGICVLLAAVGVALKLSGVVLGESAAWTGTASVIVTFGGLGVSVAMIVSLFILSIRHRRGGGIPSWVRSLMSDTIG